MEDTLWRNYNVVWLFIESRKLVPISEILTKEQFDKDVKANKYIIIECKGNIFIILVSVRSDVSNKTEPFVNMYNKLPNNSELIMFTKNDNNNKIRAYANDNDIKLFIYPMSIIHLDIRYGPGVPKHEIATEEDLNILEDNYVKRNTMPLILSIDPQAIWLGAKHGDIIKITRNSDVTLHAIYYRLCVSTM
jgi:DNA-directed RNA polymerase subunit H (RpoH/RPB5)